MQPPPDGDYKTLFTELIKKQIVILGPDITMSRVKNVPGIVVDQAGQVTSITGDPQTLLQNLINQFVELSGLIVKKTMESILANYSNMAGLAQASTAVIGIPQVIAQQVSPQQVATPPPVVPNMLEPQQPVAAPIAPQPIQPPTPTAPPPLTSEQIQELNRALETMNQTPVTDSGVKQ